MSGALSVVQPGVLSGVDALKLFEHARANKYAMPAVNITSSSVANAVLEAARDIKSPIILQISNGGGAFLAGKGLPNDKQQASVAGSVALAHHVRTVAPLYGVPVILHSDHCAKKLLPWFDGMLDADEAYYKVNGVPLFSSHMLDLSEESDEENISTCVKYFSRMAKMGQWLEMEIGITGGEEDGVNNESADASSLMTKPEQVYKVHQALSAISPSFSIAAAFGNVHGVYKPGNVKLTPEILGDHQKYAREQSSSKHEKPLFLVFHGGSGSSKEEIKTAVVNGVVKMNVDTDVQWAYLCGHRDYILNKKDYLMTQVGNPEGGVREGEKAIVQRVKVACTDLLSENKL
ncbi:hypothetical protein E3P77_03379 [Wallemia ichthyophaga]|uniref:Fructose-bisphosphate aldolase n=1 Tax=Wallemia ichthyophaga TaxID=245174 RepID=A0A4T0EYY1_WALIC|nr:hypothetical protein E3P98_03259 [Wallemia ichthyophaga]TIB09451.1 hypothetical protein E3P93_03186 [Wallemia ichthyophaga]TIB09572.1 hypothetical protein E3P90_03217 [Wallemia ichthyophaga]TIB20369.1 hypothetical protein E3P89_03235 [Wallemia ichthyophaga]TIB21967.1 hypothetical protein E3P88_03230 [Wallemia ichthyophaga]